MRPGKRNLLWVAMRGQFLALAFAVASIAALSGALALGMCLLKKIGLV